MPHWMVWDNWEWELIVVKNESDFCSIRSNAIQSAPMKDSSCVNDDIVVKKGSFEQIVYCDLPPDK